MEYFIGSIATLISLWVFSVVVKKETKQIKPIKISRTQSYSYEIIKPVLPILELLKQEPMDTQASRHAEKSTVKVLLVGSSVYWIAQNSLYTANFIDGKIDEESTKMVDTMALDDVQLDKIIFIVDTLTKEDSNDSSNPGDKKF
jgi:hypothetical protein